MITRRGFMAAATAAVAFVIAPAACFRPVKWRVEKYEISTVLAWTTDTQAMTFVDVYEFAWQREGELWRPPTMAELDDAELRDCMNSFAVNPHTGKRIPVYKQGGDYYFYNFLIHPSNIVGSSGVIRV